MGRVHDMVTGLLNGSSSMKPLFFRSRGVGLAAEDKRAPFQSPIPRWPPRDIYKSVLWGRAHLPPLTFPVGLEVAIDRRRCDVAEAAGPVAQRGAAALAGGQRGRETREVKVVRPGAHGDVHVLGTVGLGGAQRRRAGVHGHVVVVRVAAVRAGQGGSGPLGSGANRLSECD